MSPFFTGNANISGLIIFKLDELPTFDSVGGGSVFEIFADAYRNLFGQPRPTPAASRGAVGALYSSLLPPGHRNLNPMQPLGIVRCPHPEMMLVSDANSSEPG